MNRELQTRLLNQLNKPGLPWKTSPDHDSQEQATLQWLPVANLTGARVELGLSSKAAWVRATSQSATAFEPGKPCVFLLPVLELDIKELQRLLKEGLRATGLSAEFVETFPFGRVVVTGLKSHSERWASLALKWAEQLPASPELQSALQTLNTNGPTQKTRQAAHKLLARQHVSGEENESQ